MATRIAHCLPVLWGIRDILWSTSPPSNGREVRKRLFNYLSAQRRRAPQRGRGAYRRRFIEHAQKVTKSYAKGLFHCYDDPRIPQTSNAIESDNGAGKMNLRRCSGRASTANGPGSSCGRAHMFAVILNRILSEEEIGNQLSEYSIEEYRKAKDILDEVRLPSSKRRSFLRKPVATLNKLLNRWLDKGG